MSEHIPTPNEMAMALEGKTREQMVPILKGYVNDIQRISRSEGYRQGSEDSYYD